ncbi:MAG TPA: HAMP domain-containing sensor histidine kinase [Vicinamibacterales bacterium]|nr:HAMP domain-containing sensor histidine kinase [Vicinamibacterales bacterium]
MRLPPPATTIHAVPWRRLARILGVGLACGLLVWAGGRALEYLRLGGDQDALRARVETEVREAFDGMARSLHAMAEPLATANGFQAAAEGDTVAARQLFDAAEGALGGKESSELAVTAYSAGGRPVAWAGRPSELPPDRLQGPEAWFIAQGALGLRLVYVTPIISPPASGLKRSADQPSLKPGRSVEVLPAKAQGSREGGSTDGRRIGVVAAERALAPAPGVRQPDTDPLEFPSSIAPVSMYPTFQAVPTRADDAAFEVKAPSGARLLTAVVSRADLTYARQRWRRATLSLALITFAVAWLLLAGPLLDWRNVARSGRAYVTATLFIAVVVIVGRFLLRAASPADWSEDAVFSAVAYASPSFRLLLTSPFDFLVTAAAAGSLVSLALFAVEAWRVSGWRHRRTLDSAGRRAAYAALQLGVGVVVAALLIGDERFLGDTIGNTTLDLLHLSIHPWSTERLALQVGLVMWHATVLGLAVLLLRAALVPWRVPRRNWSVVTMTIVLWAAPVATWELGLSGFGSNWLPSLLAAGAAIFVALAATRLKARYRHGSQAFRLTMLLLGLVTPALVLYPAVFQMAWRAKTALVETRFAPQAINQRQTVKALLAESLTQIDKFPGLVDLLTVTDPSASGGAPIDRAFQVWRITSMAKYPLTSSVELHGPDGTLVSRFAFNLPEDLGATQKWQEPTCDWEIYEEVSPFFAEERRVLHAGRAVCAPGTGRPMGSIVVHAIRDYENLPFIASQSPYVQLLRPDDPQLSEGISGRDIEYAVYGWSRRPLYASGDTAWRFPDAVFERILESRQPVWAELSRGDASFDVYLLNDRGGIYALGFPIVSTLGHLVNLAEVTVLAAITYVLLLTLNVAFGAFSRRGTPARALLREVRASFYRKLFLAFVLAAVVPVVAMALLTRAYVAGQMRTNIESEAVRTASAAQRVVEDLIAPRALQLGVGVDDNLMVWVSRLIDQDVNIFSGARLVATSERNLFASGVVPTRTPSDVYRALVLENQASTVTQERIGESPSYLVAATPVNARPLDAILTVPLTSRQQEIERETDALDRRVLLAALLFILVGATIGYWAAERIADPVNRLTRATRRIARGELDARIAVKSSDELRRLVEAFNRMAADLQRHQQELERTHRLEAWAEMARQVAHEIKNPLTPIQLNAEHLRRVHADRGEPLGPVLQECVGTILDQVKLLRQIASEFSSFASSPTAKPSDVDVQALLHEVVNPYRMGLSERIRFDIDVPESLPRAHVDRTLVARALTNIVENALHAMPTAGTLTIVGRQDSRNGHVRIRVSDTGAGMDPEALARAFEPYFSTKAIGTGLGLPIAKRNVELNGGTIAVTSERDRGTTVEISLPTSDQDRAEHVTSAQG